MRNLEGGAVWMCAGGGGAGGGGAEEVQDSRPRLLLSEHQTKLDQLLKLVLLDYGGDSSSFCGGLEPPPGSAGDTWCRAPRIQSVQDGLG